MSKMNRGEADLLVCGCVQGVILNGVLYQGVRRTKARELLGEAKYSALLKDKIHNTGPSPGHLYPWNVVDYLCKEEPPAQEESKLSQIWSLDAGAIRTLTEEMLQRHFGPRCSVYESNCPICRRYTTMDKLLANPYDKANPQA